MKLLMKIICVLSLMYGAVECAFLNILPSDLDLLISQAEQACTIQTQYADKVQVLSELGKFFDLIETIYQKTCDIVGQHCLVVKQLDSLKRQFKQEIVKIKKERNPQSVQIIFNTVCKSPDGVSHKALKQAVIVGQEAKKWLTKSHAHLNHFDSLSSLRTKDSRKSLS